MTIYLSDILPNFKPVCIYIMLLGCLMGNIKDLCQIPMRIVAGIIKLPGLIVLNYLVCEKIK